MSRSERDKMLSGELYRPNVPEIQADRAATEEWLSRYNMALPDERRQLLLETLGSVGEDVEIRPPFFCDYGFNIRIGSGVFLNFNCVILDVVEVTIGDGTQIGPSVQIYAADHPRDPAREGPGWSSVALSGSVATSGSAERRSFFPVSSWVTTPLSAREV